MDATDTLLPVCAPFVSLLSLLVPHHCLLRTTLPLRTVTVDYITLPPYLAGLGVSSCASGRGTLTRVLNPQRTGVPGADVPRLHPTPSRAVCLSPCPSASSSCLAHRSLSWVDLILAGSLLAVWLQPSRLCSGTRLETSTLLLLLRKHPSAGQIVAHKKWLSEK